MNKKKLLSIFLAALMIFDVVCFALTLTYHVTACDAGDTAVSFEIIDAPTGEYSSDVVIVDYAYESVVPEKEPVIGPAYIRFDKTNVTSDPMVFENMFPGDRVSRTYKIKVHRQNVVGLWFFVEIHDDVQYEKLAEVLMLDLRVNGREAYNGLLKDFTGHNVGLIGFYPDGTDDVLEYEINVYLDTSVGNEYMQKTLKCDYIWQAFENMPQPTPPQPEEPGEDVEIIVPDEGHFNSEEFIYIPEPCNLAIACVIMSAVFVASAGALILPRRKEDSREEK